MIKKKILFNISGSGNRSINREGAIPKIIANYIDILSKSFDITLFGCFSFKNPSVKVIPYTKRMELEKGYFINDIKFLFFGLFKILKIQTDIIISTHERNFLLSFLYSKLKRKPIIAWELDHEFWTPPWTKIKKLFHFLINNCNCVIAISSEQYNRMTERGIRENKLKIVYLGVDSSKYCPRKEIVKDKYILYVAKFTDRKNQLVLLQEFKKIIIKYSEFKLILVGPKRGGFTSKSDKPSSYYLKCLDYINNNELTDKVVFKENLNEDELIKLYQNAFLFLFPSLEEGFGLSLLEAMSCGCCCLSNNIQPMLEILDKTGLLIDVSKSFSDKIIELIENSNLKKQFSTLARERVEKMYSWNITVAGFEKIIRDLL